jgi:hypothetical protein
VPFKSLAYDVNDAHQDNFIGLKHVAYTYK